MYVHVSLLCRILALTASSSGHQPYAGTLNHRLVYDLLAGRVVVFFANWSTKNASYSVELMFLSSNFTVLPSLINHLLKTLAKQLLSFRLIVMIIVNRDLRV